MRPGRLVVLLLAALAAACGSGAPPAPALRFDAGAAQFAYRLRPGDVLALEVYGVPELSGELQVGSDGRVPLPLAGDVALDGLTPEQAEARIVDALQPDYLRAPQVRVELLSHRPFYILGEVRRPGAYPYSPGMTVIEAVALAGGYTYRAREEPVTILRRRGPRSAELEGDATTRLLPGDAVRVGARYF